MKQIKVNDLDEVQMNIEICISNQIWYSLTDYLSRLMSDELWLNTNEALYYIVSASVRVPASNVLVEIKQELR